MKGKRRRSLIKKAIELSKMLEMDIMMVMRCRDTGRVFVYGSEDGSHPEGGADGPVVFDLKKAIQAVQHREALNKKVAIFSDSDYAKLSRVEDVREDEDHESVRD